MESALNRKPEDLEDYYGILGCDELSSNEQILNEYKVRALACHPDKHLDNPTAVTDFQKLQEAKEVLSNEAKRKNYDLWKRSGVTISFHEWRGLNESVKTSMHWATSVRKERMLEASQAQPTPSQAHLNVEQQAPEVTSHEAAPPSGKPVCTEKEIWKGHYCHRRFRWAAESPSTLLQRFRNYEI